MENNLENWNEFLKKEIKLVYEDGTKFPSQKKGVLANVTDSHFILFLAESKKYEAILKSKVLRIELKGAGDGR